MLGIPFSIQLYRTLKRMNPDEVTAQRKQLYWLAFWGGGLIGLAVAHNFLQYYPGNETASWTLP